MLRVLVVSGAALLVGCSAPYPPYRVSSVVQDPSLIGSWRVLDEDESAREEAEREAEGRLSESERREREEQEEREHEAGGRFLKFDARPVGISDGRLDTTPPDSHAFEAGHSHAVQYTVRLLDEGQEKLFAGYLLQVGDEQVLGLQYDGPEIAELGALVLPVHQFFRIEHEEEELELWTPAHPVAWLPQVEPADGPEDPAAGLDTHDAENGAFRISGSIDRVLDYYAAHTGDPGFWSDTKIICKRVEVGEEND